MMNPNYHLRALNSMHWGEFAHFAATGLVKHGFSTRLGGVSQHPFTSLNLGLHTGDDLPAVQENRRLYCDVFALDVNQAVTADQVHGEAIAVITKTDCGRGALVYETAIPKTDALITNVLHVPIMMFYADCVPVYFLDPVNQAIGIAHAGWKGTVALIGQKTLTMMAQTFGTKPETCLVGIGPSIGPCCYEVDQFVYDKVQASFPYADELLVPTQPGKWRLDLWTANRHQLEDIGVDAKNIVVAKVCTSCNTHMYFSYRSENGKTGRMGALMALRETSD
jgi:polyphenol oxidase